MDLSQLVARAPGESGLSLVEAIPIAEEPGIGALTIGGYLDEVCARHGDAEAVSFNTEAQRLSWSYRELREEALGVARALIAQGMAPGERIGILMTNRPEFLSAFFGIAMAGGVAVALSTFSTQGELDHLLGASQVTTLLMEAQVLKTDFAAMVTALDPVPGTRHPALRKVVALGAQEGSGIVEWRAWLAQGAGVGEAQVAARLAMVAPEDPGGIFFSSGTTSAPKGIAHSQQAFAIQWWRWPRLFAMHEPVRAWTGNGFFWSGNISMVVGAALSTGGCIVLQRYFDAAEALRVIEAERVTFANGRPHQWARLQAEPGWAGADLSSLRYVPRGELIWAHPSVSTDWEVPQTFGTTETMSACTCIGRAASEADYAGSYGLPLPGNTLKIVDPQTRELVPEGEHGEMCIKGPTLMSGYLGKSGAQCFDPEGFYCTGDGGRVDALGRFYWEGRLTAMIKTGGANVAPEEIDEIVANWPGVKRVQTVGVEDALLGERVVTCLVPLDGAEIDGKALLAHLRSQLASFKCPKEVLVCTEEDFAITGNEKVRPAQVRAMAQRRLAATAP
ncbi:acyl--CoA ligase [Novosphingobium sp. YJ-S2-02]|uniref:Acyl--CoA ligase n=1 Tax=Novosphingobium aureum TaxID=2792964 RepID=A0A931HE48_9SPHN|nr:class I adenylate-forming enzyme family protein [Novosphingobium aureum]MBH0114425.1 acyl--CoA ligase [Novosphingobium aureum]